MGIEASVETGEGGDGRHTNANPPRRRVLVTGAAGRIGSNFARGHGEHHHNAYDLRLMVRGDEEGIDDIRPLGEVVTADLADVEALKEICAGVDTIVHLAGDPSASAVWKDLLAANVVGTYHVFAAAKARGVRRVVYASSIHAVSGYPADVQVKAHDPVNPGDLYGVSKCFGEALCRYMAEQEGVRAVAIRIGAFQPVERAQDPKSLPMLDAFLSHRDMNQLLVRAIEAPDSLRFALVHGISDNRFKRLDISSARDLLGYAPEDDFTALNPQLQPLGLPEKVHAHNVSDPGQRSGLRAEVGDG